MILQLCEQGEGAVGVPGGTATDASDVALAGEAVAADGEVAQGGHDRGSVGSAGLGQVLFEGDVADAVQLVLDAPVPADRLSEQVGTGCAPGQAGDRVDGLAGFGRRVQRATTAPDRDGEAGVRDTRSLPLLRRF